MQTLEYVLRTVDQWLAFLGLHLMQVLIILFTAGCLLFWGTRLLVRLSIGVLYVLVYGLPALTGTYGAIAASRAGYDNLALWVFVGCLLTYSFWSKVARRFHHLNLWEKWNHFEDRLGLVNHSSGYSSNSAGL